ncbi:MAG TPA: flavodoxin/nitric oxide synthase [Propionibacteriaceae bacterium]|nr:flavodoxin domain-containing protein [Micropruina sp.]HBX80179.1 flavodoxin/nitric oxide synthase [Propionibacteriaceae bacterium]HBY21872.1 flavodoxin/nitric oxide synthase [Propionibacteriaceae bacterium]
MKVLLVVESMFGNTAAVAQAIAAGLRGASAEVELVAADHAPNPAGADLVLVGAPTHNLGLPTPKSREIAASQGAEVPACGVAEWLASLGRFDRRNVASFDTAVPSVFSGSAAKQIVQRARRLGATIVDRQSFRVAGSPPVLADGELARAEGWGRDLVAKASPVR